MRRRAAWTILAVVALIIVGGAACSRDSGQNQGAGRSFDAFLSKELGLIDYAQRRARNTCLADRGFRQNLDAMAAEPSDPFASLVITERTFGARSEAEARLQGFGEHLPSQPPQIVSYDANYDKSMAECVTLAWDSLGPDAQQLYMNYFQLGNDLLPALPEINSRLPSALPNQFLDCLDTKGYRVPDREAYLRAPDVNLFGVKFGRYETATAEWRPDPGRGNVASLSARVW